MVDNTNETKVENRTGRIKTCKKSGLIVRENLNCTTRSSGVDENTVPNKICSVFNSLVRENISCEWNRGAKEERRCETCKGYVVRVQIFDMKIEWCNTKNHVIMADTAGITCADYDKNNDVPTAGVSKL
jgi:hypothetical protein